MIAYYVIGGGLIAKEILLLTTAKKKSGVRIVYESRAPLDNLYNTRKHKLKS